VDTAVRRIQIKVSKIIKQNNDDQELIDQEIDQSMDLNEILTLHLLPIGSKLRKYIFNCFAREFQRKELAKINEVKLRKHEIVLKPLIIEGGGKCKFVSFITVEAAIEFGM